MQQLNQKSGFYKVIIQPPIPKNINNNTTNNNVKSAIPDLPITLSIILTINTRADIYNNSLYNYLIFN